MKLSDLIINCGGKGGKPGPCPSTGDASKSLSALREQQVSWSVWKVKNGNDITAWEKHNNALTPQISKAQDTLFISKWHEGHKMPGNDMVNFLRNKGVETPTDLKGHLQHDDTVVHLGGVDGKFKSAPAKKIHKFLGEAMHRITASHSES